MDERVKRINALIALYRCENNKTYGDIAAELNIKPITLYKKRKGTAPWLWREILQLSNMTNQPLEAFK